MRLRVGDKIEVIREFIQDGYKFQKGDTGTVVGIFKHSRWIQVKWDFNALCFHDCNGLTEYGYGYSIEPTKIKNLKQIKRKRGNVYDF